MLCVWMHASVCVCVCVCVYVCVCERERERERERESLEQPTRRPFDGFRIWYIMSESRPTNQVSLGS